MLEKGTALSDDLQLSVLVRCLRKHIQQHVQLQMSESSTYDQVRSLVFGYERVTQSWTDKKIFAELGVVSSYGTPGGPAAMEIDQLQQRIDQLRIDQRQQKGKGKQKGKENKGKTKGKGKYDDNGGKVLQGRKR